MTLILMFKLANSVGDVLCLIAGEDHLYRLEDKLSHDLPSGEELGIDTQPTQRQDLDQVPMKRSPPLKRTKSEDEELKNEDSIDFSQESDKSKRRRFSGQAKPELIPLEFEFDENGGKVKVIDLTDEDSSSISGGTGDLSNQILEVAQVLPHLERSVIRRTLQSVDGNVEAAINMLLGETEETSSDVHDRAQSGMKFIQLYW